MAAYKRQLRDKDGNTIYPDVGLELDDVIYGSNPEQVETPSPWIETADIKDGQITSAKIDWSSMEHWSITLSGNKTISQAAAYNYVDVPDASVTFTATVGGVYLVLLNASITCAGGSTDCYARALLNGGNVAVGVGHNLAANKFISVASAQVFTATQASNTIKMQLGGGIANANYTILGSVQSSVQIMRIA